MIRVNLLPQKKKAERGVAAPSLDSGDGQRWILVVLGLVILEVIVFVFFHQTKVAELEEQQTNNSKLSAEIGAIRTLVQQHEQVKKDLDLLKAREQAIQKLENGRKGPTSALLELSRIVTAGRGPTVDPDRFQQNQKNNPLQAISPGWDPRRIWLMSFKEKGRIVEIIGLARDSADVSELAYRLKASSYFYDVKLLPGKKEEAGKGQNQTVAMVSFGMQLKVRY